MSKKNVWKGCGKTWDIAFFIARISVLTQLPRTQLLCRRPISAHGKCLKDTPVRSHVPLNILFLSLSRSTENSSEQNYSFSVDIRSIRGYYQYTCLLLAAPRLEAPHCAGHILPGGLWWPRAASHSLTVWIIQKHWTTSAPRINSHMVCFFIFTSLQYQQREQGLFEMV